MGKTTRGYKAWFSILFGLLSLGAYVAMVWFGVNKAWDQAMRNGEPGILALEPIGKIAMTETYRTHIFYWCLVFAALWVLLMIFYWLLGCSKEDAGTIRRTAKWFRYTALSMMLVVYLAYWKYNFAGEQCMLILSYTQLLIAVFWAVGYVLHMLGVFFYHRKTKVSRNPKKQAKRMAVKARTYKEKLAGIDFMPVLNGILSLCVSLVDLLANITTLPMLVASFLSFIKVPVPFEVITPYDWCVLLLPLVGIILFAFNLKYNAPPIVGDKLTYEIHPFKDVYTMVDFLDNSTGGR